MVDSQTFDSVWIINSENIKDHLQGHYEMIFKQVLGWENYHAKKTVDELINSNQEN